VNVPLLPVKVSSLHTMLDELGRTLEEELLGTELELLGLLDEEGLDELELAMELELRTKEETGIKILELLGVGLGEEGLLCDEGLLVELKK